MDTEFLKNLDKLNICVLGFGISNFPLIRFLSSHGAKKITVLDRNDSEENSMRAESLKAEGISLETVFGENYLNSLTENKFDVIFKTPVIRFDIPEIRKAVQNGALLTSEMEVFLNICPCKIFAVTGSDGKTTTTTLISRFLQKSAERKNVRTWVGGNIGTPLLPIADEISENDYVVVELSSFQLMNMNAETDVAVITNISPNHLDVHKDYAEYISAKKNIFKNNGRDSVTVLNSDNEETAECICEVPGHVRTFSRRDKNAFAFFDGTKIFINSDFEIDRRDILLPGNHNVENYMAAISAVYGEVAKEDILEVARTFGGVEHRLELVRVLNGVKYYNSSIDSSPNRTINALSVFDGNVILIAGGKDKKIPYDSIGPAIADKVKVLILTGPTAGKIKSATLSELHKRNLNEDYVRIYMAKDYTDAVQTAKNLATDGDTVLLSPASTSFDTFKNFEERGNVFKSLVKSL